MNETQVLQPKLPCASLSGRSRWHPSTSLPGICRCAYVDFDVAVFTNIMQDKVDAFGTMAEYLDSQGVLFRKLNDPSRQRAVVNADGNAAYIQT